MGIIVHSFGKCGSSSIYRTLLANGWEAAHVHYLRRPVDGQNINALYMIRRGEHTHVIIPIREPVARNLSAYYHNMVIYGKHPATVKAFLEKYDHEIPFKWMETELAGYWGLDVYREPFDKARGWQICDDKFLVIRCKDLTREWRNAYTALTGMDAIDLVIKNIQMDKRYQEIKKQQIPKGYIDRMHNTKFYRHFYD